MDVEDMWVDACHPEEQSDEEARPDALVAGSGA
jgi:hypothetical protein